MVIASSSFSKVLLAGLMAAMVPDCLSASAKTPDPILKPGLWEIVVTESLRKDSEVTNTWCVGPNAKEVKLAQKEFDVMRRTCKFTDVISGKGLVSYTRACTKEYGVTIAARVVTKGDFSSEFTKTQIASVDIPTPLEGMTQTSHFKYKGQCPKDMAPGDSVTRRSDGTTMPKWNRYDPPQPSKAPPSIIK
jgi:hypothetical protein